MGCVPSDVCAHIVIATEESTRVSSSTAIAYASVSPPAPPTSSGNGIPMSPSSPSLATISYGKRFSWSSASATGATSPSAKSRTVRRISSWSGERSKSMRPFCLSPGSTRSGVYAPLGRGGGGERDQQPHAVARAALGRVGLARVPRRPGDVEVRPRHVAHEPPQELGGGDGGGAAVLDGVEDVAVAALDELGVLRVQRQPPQDLARPPARRGHLLAPLVVRAHQAGVGGAERGDDRARERGEV